MFTHMISAIPMICLIVGCSIAAASDLKTRRIPNLIPGVLAIIALAAQFSQGMKIGFISFAIGFGVLIIGTILHSIKWMGGGDIKLLAAGAFLVGPSQAANFLFFSFVAGGILGLFTLLFRRQLQTTLPSLLMRIQNAAVVPELLLQSQSRIVLPYALAIAAGAIACAFAPYMPAALRIT